MGEVYDANTEMLQTLDMEDLPRAQKRFAKQFEKVNAERIKEIFAKNYKVSRISYKNYFLTFKFSESYWFWSFGSSCCWNLLLYNQSSQTRDFP